MAAVVARVRAEVKAAMSEAEGSHDFHHVHRVHAATRTIAQSEGLGEHDMLLAELAAWLHDVADYKLTGHDDARPAVLDLCRRCEVTEDVAQAVAEIVQRVSWHSSLEQDSTEFVHNHILRCVQDADRLDAIGAIGIARTFAYGGSKGRALYDPEAHPPRKLTDVIDKETYMKESTPTINHFYDKLLRLRSTFHTPKAQAMAQQRHDFMLAFLDQFYHEWNGEAVEESQP